MSHTTQCRKLLKALRRKQGITSLEAAQTLFITSLHRRLADLRAMGVVIMSNPFTTANGARCKRYFAVSVPECFK